MMFGRLWHRPGSPGRGALGLLAPMGSCARSHAHAHICVADVALAEQFSQALWLTSYDIFTYTLDGLQDTAALGLVTRYRIQLH